MTAGTRNGNGISQSASANLTRNPNGNIERDKGGIHITADTISFTAPATIGDTGSGLSIFTIGDLIQVNGSVSNDQVLRVLTVAAGELTVENQTVTTESAGALVELRAV